MCRLASGDSPMSATTSSTYGIRVRQEVHRAPDCRGWASLVTAGRKCARRRTCSTILGAPVWLCQWAPMVTRPSNEACAPSHRSVTSTFMTTHYRLAHVRASRALQHSTPKLSLTTRPADIVGGTSISLYAGALTSAHERQCSQGTMAQRAASDRVSPLTQKIDCEGCEYSSLPRWLRATCTSQILIEMHLLDTFVHENQIGHLLRRFHGLMSHLEERGYAVFSSEVPKHAILWTLPPHARPHQHTDVPSPTVTSPPLYICRSTFWRYQGLCWSTG